MGRGDISLFGGQSAILAANFGDQCFGTSGFASMDTREVPYDDGHGAFRRPLLTSMPRLANDIQHRNLLRTAPEQRIGFLVRHAACSSLPAAIHASRKSERARASRDMTVPTGAPITSAISRYERSFSSRRTKVSR